MTELVSSDVVRARRTAVDDRNEISLTGFSTRIDAGHRVIAAVPPLLDGAAFAFDVDEHHNNVGLVGITRSLQGLVRVCAFGCRFYVPWRELYVIGTAVPAFKSCTVVTDAPGSPVVFHAFAIPCSCVDIFDGLIAM
jgi:hypothetical protein